MAWEVVGVKISFISANLPASFMWGSIHYGECMSGWAVSAAGVHACMHGRA